MTETQYCTDCRKQQVPNKRPCENPKHVGCNEVCNECGYCGSLNITENTGITGIIHHKERRPEQVV